MRRHRSREGKLRRRSCRGALAGATLAVASVGGLVAGLVGAPGALAGASSRRGAVGHGGGSPFTICAIAATSGAFVELGKYDVIGAEAWVKEVNRQGGLLGHKVSMVVENDNSDPATAASLVRKCVEQVHANVIFGPEETSTATAAIPVAVELHELEIGWQSGWIGQGIPTPDLTSFAFPVQANVFFADDLATVQNLILPRHYHRVAVVQDNAPGGLGNAAYMSGLGKKDHFKVVATQTLAPGSTDDTPAALALLKANPQIVVLGMIPGADTITIIKAIRAQNPTIPISECSGCALPSFVQAVGVKAMHNVYLIGTPSDILKLPKTKANLPAIKATAAYIAGMRSTGFSSTDDVDQSGEGYAAGVELQAAAEAAKSLSTSALLKAMQHEAVVTGGLQAYYWHRTPKDYANITKIVAAMDTISPSGKPVVVAG